MNMTDEILNSWDEADELLAEKIEKANANISSLVTQVIPTDNAAISSKTGKVMIIGNVAFVDMRIITTSEINEWTDVFKKLPAPVNGVGISVTASNVTYDMFMNANNNFLQTKKTMPAGTYTIRYYYIIA